MINVKTIEHNELNLIYDAKQNIKDPFIKNMYFCFSQQYSAVTLIVWVAHLLKFLGIFL